MKTKKLKKFIRTALMIATLSMTVLFIGHGCSEFGSSNKAPQPSSATGQAGNDGLNIIPNTKTVSTVYAKQFMDNMVSCTGLRIESARTRGEFENRKGSLSEFGYATDITPPMLMSIAAIAGEVCSDLIAKEAASQNQMMFEGFSFPNGSVSTGDLHDAIQRMALSCWHRRALDSEVNLISSMIDETADNRNSEQSALLLCTAMLSSYKSIEM